MDEQSERDTHAVVQQYYGETLESSADLKTTACCTAAAPSEDVSALLADIHEEVASRYYGCGLVLPEALDGLRILDLGCGAGRDVYLLARLVGADGFVTGVDMTPAQLDVARAFLDYHMERYGYGRPNIEFVQANIEALDQTDLADASYDLIVSNCVVNLAVDKAAVLRSAYRLLKPGGEMYFSDIYADRRVPAELRNDPVMYGECLAGAMYWNDFVMLARDCGFADPRMVEESPVDVTDPELAARAGELRFRSVTCRLFRAPGLEANREDYGQQAVYSGGVPGHPGVFRLDADFAFPRGEAVAVCGNTARILTSGRFSEFFTIIDPNTGHLGAFDGISSQPDFSADDSAAPGGGCC